MPTTDTTTGTDLLTQALKKAGVLGAGVDAEGEDLTDALSDLNDMIAQWRVQNSLVYRLINTGLTSTGATSYTVGSGGNYNLSPRPNRIESAFVRQLNNGAQNQVDTPLELVFSRQDYDRLALKTLGSFPQFLWYDAAWPTGSIYPWPVPSATIYAVHITTKQVLSEIAQADVANAISLPGEYFAALKFNLARRLRSAYRLPPDKELNDLAADALGVIRGANVQIPRMQVDPQLTRGGGLYDIYSDQVY